MSKRWTLLAILFLTGCTRSPSSQPIFVGHVATLSGPDAHGGEQAAKGMRLAIQNKDLAQIDGRLFQVRHTDTRGQTDAYEAQAVRLVAVSKCAVIYGGETPEEVLRLEKSRVPVLSPCGHRPGGVSDQVFFLGMSPSVQGQALARLAVERLGFASLLTLSPTPFSLFTENRPPPSVVIFKDERSPEAEQVVRAFSLVWDELWTKRGVTAASSPVVLSFGKEVRWDELVAKGLAGNPACVVFAGGPDDFGSLLSRATGTPMILFAGEDGALRQVPNGHTVYRATGFAEQAGTGEFVAKFKAAHSVAPDVHAALAYDAIRILADGMSKANTSGNSLAYELRGIKNFAGVTGPLSFGSDQVARRPVFLMRCTGHAAHLEMKIDP